MDGVQANTYFIHSVNMIHTYVNDDEDDDGDNDPLDDNDDEQGFSCIIHTGCLGGGEVVACSAKYAHDYPFGPDR